MSLLLAIPPVPGAGVEPPRCSLCEEPILGQYARYEELGYDVCGACRQAEPCAGCTLPMTGFLGGDETYCSRCLGSAPRCAACGLPTPAGYWTVAGADGFYCGTCIQDAPRCASCVRPVLDGRILDERFFCADCRPGLVNDGETYHRGYDRVLALASDRLGLEIRRPPSLIVESVASLHAEEGRSYPRGRLCGLYQRDGTGRSTIRVLTHLGWIRALSVLAHEIAHAWQAENCPSDQGIRLREGFAEWVAWKLLETIPGGEGERAVIEARTDDYGVGFRILADVEARFGTEHALWYALHARSGVAASKEGAGEERPAAGRRRSRGG